MKEIAPRNAAVLAAKWTDEKRQAARQKAMAQWTPEARAEARRRALASLDRRRNSHMELLRSAWRAADKATRDTFLAEIGVAPGTAHAVAVR